jgi:hypothetical protein
VVLITAGAPANSRKHALREILLLEDILGARVGAIFKKFFMKTILK